MACIYSKSTPTRKPLYQIITEVHESDDGSKYVVKYCPYVDGIENIKRIHNISKKLANIYGEKYCDVEIIDNTLVSAYYDNSVSLSYKVRNAILNEDDDILKEYLDLWRKCIVGSNNSCRFYGTSEFNNIFGEFASRFDGVEATCISNLDCSAENILILPSGEVKIIDYEWTFDFPIPVDMVLYYNIRLFSTDIQCRNVLDKLVSILKINEEYISDYDTMIANFADYVAKGENGVDYRVLGSKFLKPAYSHNFMIGNYKYSLPRQFIIRGNRLVVYGAGDVGRDYVAAIKDDGALNLIGWLDKNAAILSKGNNEIFLPEKIKLLEYDHVLIAVCNKSIAESMEDILLQYGVMKEKIIWDKDRLM